jgi:hypothetical protein
MFSDKKTAGLSDQRLKTGRSDYIFSRQKELVLERYGFQIVSLNRQGNKCSKCGTELEGVF